MSRHAEWIEDLLGAAKADRTQASIALIERCGVGCATRQNAFEGVETLKKQAAGCKTISDYAAFLNRSLPVRVEEVGDGLVMHLNKESCTCPMAGEIHENKEMLCHCTCGHEKAVWSAFFGRPVDVEILESFLRGGKDCVIKIKCDIFTA